LIRTEGSIENILIVYFHASQMDYAYLKHTLTANQIGNAALMADWRAIVESYNTKPGREKYVKC